MEPTADIGVIGLAVMGRNLILNMADHGYTVAAYNRTTTKVDEFLAGEAAGTSVVGAHTLSELVAQLRTPRRVMLMVRAGGAVDAVIDELLPLLDPGDIVVDGGNSQYTDTIRRTEALEDAGFMFVGTGISGGEEGARYGPSIMPGGSAAAWPAVKDIFQSIAAEAEGEPCCDWVGPDGAGHYVKMVHNGIEYGDMQVIAEAYDLLSRGAGILAKDMQPIFTEWNRGPLDSFLIEITADIMGFTDEDGEPLVERILDAAGQKGTGKWTVISSMHLGMPTSLIAEAVYARVVSSLVEQRRTASTVIGTDPVALESAPADIVSDLHDALYGSKIVSYAQGFMLMAAASEERGWNLDLGRVAALWRAGCIIRSRFLNDITAAYRREPELANLLLDPFFAEEIDKAEPGWRRTVVRAVESGIPAPAYAAALSFYDAYRSERLPANLIQAQRDYFGAHTYERIDRPRGEFFHTNWTGTGGDTSAGTYEA
ncbi:MAG TPA: decarboxylating NADP(+)-dependent phosphogluconate dehydrogenase [Acidimicrobiia bacterium]|jgi:6-phosphogluconate dehydrogenase|nr:decarboxylating NADP(+)-dependent phosphogluconate dehydrogenase [Acidimicrobiia bacterium]